MNNSNGNELLPGLRAGDSAAFRRLMELFRPMLMGIVSRRLQSSGDQEDVVQETFVRFYRSLPQFRGDCSVKSRLWRIALNAATNRWYHNQRRGGDRTISLDYCLEGGGTVGDLIPEEARDEVETGELEGRIVSAMERMPLDFRTVLELRNVKHLTYDEIGRRLGINIGTVKSRIARARQHLRKVLESPSQAPQVERPRKKWKIPKKVEYPPLSPTQPQPVSMAQPQPVILAQPQPVIPAPSTGKRTWRQKPGRKRRLLLPEVGGVKFFGMFAGKKLDQVVALLKEGKSTRQVAAISGAGKVTVLKARACLQQAGVNLTCGCGLSSGHKGWCAHRLKSSERRQDFLKRWRGENHAA